VAADPLDNRWRIGPTLTLLTLFALIAGAVFYVRTGESEFDTGVVTGFGSYAHETVNQPLVLVRLSNGRVQQVVAPRQTLHSCTVGQPINLMRQGQVWRPAPFACGPMESR
jgi:hypothetical protein